MRHPQGHWSGELSWAARTVRARAKRGRTFLSPRFEEPWLAEVVDFSQREAPRQLAVLRTSSGELVLVAYPRVLTTGYVLRTGSVVESHSSQSTARMGRPWHL